MEASLEKKDLENGKHAETTQVQQPEYDHQEGEVAEAKRAYDIRSSSAFFRGLHNAEAWMDRKFGVETRGIDRIPEDKKQPPSTWNIFLMWWSLNVHVGVIPLGILGPTFGLTLKQSVASSIIGIVLGALTTSYTGTLGPKVP